MKNKINEETKEKLKSVAENMWFARTFIKEDTKIYNILEMMERDFHTLMGIVDEK